MNDFNSLFWLLCAGLLLLAAAFIFLPWLNARRRADEAGGAAAYRVQANITLYRERERELRAEHAAGELAREELDALLVELQQSLLTDVEDVEPRRQSNRVENDGGEAGGRAPAWLLPLALFVLLPLAAVLMYRQWGQLDEVALMDQFQRTVQNENDVETARELVLSLGRVVQEDPERPWAWYFLGENFSTLGMFDVANSAYRQAAERLREDDEKALAMGRVALTAYILQQLDITPEVRELIDATLALNPDEPNVLQLLASDAEQNGDFDAAIGYWRRLSQLNPESQTARESIASLQRLRAGEAGADAGPSIDVSVAIADELSPNPQLRVFVTARNAAMEGMPPLAVAAFTVADLPTSIRLDDSLAVGPFNLSSATSVYVSALVSQSGTANRAPGDFFAETDPFPLENPPQPLELLISEIVP